VLGSAPSGDFFGRVAECLFGADQAVSRSLIGNIDRVNGLTEYSSEVHLKVKTILCASRLS